MAFPCCRLTTGWRWEPSGGLTPYLIVLYTYTCTGCPLDGHLPLLRTGGQGFLGPLPGFLGPLLGFSGPHPLLSLPSYHPLPSWHSLTPGQLVAVLAKARAGGFSGPLPGFSGPHPDQPEHSLTPGHLGTVHAVTVTREFSGTLPGFLGPHPGSSGSLPVLSS